MKLQLSLLDALSALTPPKALLILSLALLSPFTTAYGDTLFYRCDARRERIEFKALYEAGQQTHIIRSIEAQGYDLVGEHLLTYNALGYLVSLTTQVLDCQIHGRNVITIIGVQPGNINAMGSCGAWSTHWVAVIERGQTTPILPMTVLSTCQGDEMIYSIKLDLRTIPPQIDIAKTNINNFLNKAFLNHLLK